MRVSLAGIELANPLTVASGTFASGREYADVWHRIAQNEPGLIRNRRFPGLDCMGALTTKAVSLAPWSGNATPRIAETASGMLNSIGLQNPGVEAFCERDLAWLATQNVPVIVNIAGHSLDEYVAVIDRLERESVPSAYELNISCPNVDAGGMAFGTDAHLAAELVGRCRRATTRPLIVKLTPNVGSIADIAKAVRFAGADALSLINTVLGMSIDARARRTILARGFGGLSGPAIKPIALYKVYECHEAVDLPLIGMGGVSSATDVVEFMLAGASVVAIGSANFSDSLALPRILDDLEDYCKEQGIHEVKSLVGALR
jgi:dihydroorotate dehydrogenase (NAD+) catalytic subunit